MKHKKRANTGTCPGHETPAPCQIFGEGLEEGALQQMRNACQLPVAMAGAMAAPGYVVRGKGSEASLLSASHGAGRRMSRTRARAQFTWADAQRVLHERPVTLLSAGLDEVPMAYKDIDEVMGAQRTLVDTVARFDPRLVKMAPAGEAPED